MKSRNARPCPRLAPRRLGAALGGAAALLLLAAASGASFAQDAPLEPGIPPTKKKDDAPKGSSGGRIRMGEPGDEGKAPAEPAKKEPPAEPPKPQRSETDEWIALLSKWPAIEAKQASIRLAAEAGVSTPALLKELEAKSADWRRTCGVAATLGKIGDQRALDLLLAKLQDRTMFTHSADLFDAIVRIDAVGAKPRLMAQLLHPAASVVDEAASRLRDRVGPPDAAPLRDILEAGGPAARLAAVTLLVRADPAAARTSLVPVLRDPAPDVAFAAAKVLAADDDPEAQTVLERATVSPIDRQVAYACVALALRGERTGKRTIDDATVRLLLGGRGLSGIDPVSKAAAAVVLADVGYFHEVAALDDVLDRKIVPELIDVVAGRSFWPDVKVFQPLAVRRLQRLTGRSSGSTADEWIAWWQQAASTFHARRVLLEIPDEQVRTFAMTLRGRKAPGAEGTTFAVAAEGLSWAASDDFAVLLPEADALTLAHAVNASGLLRGVDSGAAAEGIAPLDWTVRAGRRVRRLSFSGDLGAPGVADVLAVAERLRARFAWQRYRTQSQALDLESFVELVGKRFADDRPEAERAAAFADLVTAALDDARGEAWNVRALEELRAVPSLGDALGDDGTRRLLARLGQRKDLDLVAEGIVLTLSKAARPEAHPLLLDFLTTRTSPRCRDLLVQVHRDARPKDLAAGLADESVVVRAAALASLGDASPRETAEAAVKKALGEPDVTIRREAVRALGRLRCEWARKDVEDLAAKPGDLRAAAVEALGRLGGRSALPVLMSAFSADDPGLRVTAVEALGATHEPEAISAVAFAMSMDPAPIVRDVASRVLVEFGTDRAAAELRRVALDRGQPAGPRARALGGLVLIQGRDALPDLTRLVEDPADEVADEAALGLSRWREAAAVPQLLRMLEKGRQVRSARKALEVISLELFSQDDRELVANLYTGWWEAAKDRGPRGWLVDALALAGIDEPVLRDWEAGRAGREVVPVLVRGLRTESWALRHACDLVLRDLTQRSFGDFEEFTTPSEAGRMADAWAAWWAAQVEAESEPR